MFEAQLLKDGQTVYSPWFPRGGDNLRATLEVVDIQGTGATLTVSVFTKNSEDTSNGADADSSVSFIETDAGRVTKEWVAQGAKGLKEMVRYKFAATATEDGWVLFRMLTPVWFDAVALT